MKSYINHSRFIQPRRIPTSTEKYQQHDVANDGDMDRKDIWSVETTTTTTAATTSPDTVVDTAPMNRTDTTIVHNIEDILCNLESVYSNDSNTTTSFRKWDNIRKNDEYEHALMRGILLHTNNDNDTNTNDGDDDDSNNNHETNIIMKHDYESERTYDNDISLNKQPLNEPNLPQAQEKQEQNAGSIYHSTLNKNVAISSSTLTFILYLLVLLLVLRISSFLNTTSNGYCTA